MGFEFWIYIALNKKTPGETTLIQTSALGSKVQVPRTLKWNEVTFPQNWTLENENHPLMIQHPTQNLDLCLSWCTYSKLCISRLSDELLATWGFLESWYLRWEPSWLVGHGGWLWSWGNNQNGLVHNYLGLKVRDRRLVMESTKQQVVMESAPVTDLRLDPVAWR